MTRGLGAALGVLALAAPAQAVVPSAERVAAAVAEGNAEAGRAGGLRMEVTLRSADGRVEAEGVAWFDPSGAALLELHEPDGTLEVHRLHNGTHRAERGGVALPSPRPLLPPGQLLQAESAAELRGALLSLGADVDRVDLGLEGEHDCLVIGGRERALRAGEPSRRAALWVDRESFQPVRIDRGDGVRFRLGPALTERKLRFPSFLEVETADARRWRLEFRRVSRGSLPAAPRAFSTEP